MPYKIIKVKSGYKIRKPSGRLSNKNYHNKKAAKNTVTNWERYSKLIGTYEKNNKKRKGRGCCRNKR